MGNGDGGGGWVPGQTTPFKARAGRARQARSGKAGVSTLKALTALSRARSPSAYASGAGTKAQSKVSRFGAGRLAGSGAHRAAAMQRVIVKTYIGKTLSAKGVRAAAEHLRYLQREGAGDGGERGVAFNENGELSKEELTEFRRDMVEDRHHFRVMISPENGSRIDLQEYARDLVKQMETDFGTEVEWLGVIHKNTDNPHVHLVIRGVNDRGGDLVISRQYLSNGMRHSAEDLATQRLGHRTEHEIEQALKRDLVAERFTQLDKQIIASAATHPEGYAVTHAMADTANMRAVTSRNNMIARLHYLEQTGLVAEMGPGLWQIDNQLEQKLRGLSKNNDIIKQIHSRMAGRENALNTVVYDKDHPPEHPVVGRVVARAATDELSDRQFIAVSSTEGQIYYVALSPYSERAGFESKPGSIVSVSSVSSVSPAQATAADKNIARYAKNNGAIYDAQGHQTEVVEGRKLPPGASSAEYILSHTKRLDALASRGLVEKLGDGRYQVPDDLLERVQAPAAKGMDKGNFVRVERLSLNDLGAQVKAEGATWLDQQIARGEGDKPPTGISKSKFQIELSQAVQDRLIELRNGGLAVESDGGRIIPKRNFINALYEREIASTHQRLEVQHGSPVPLVPGARITGKLERIEQLSSGPHAVIEDGRRFALVPVTGNMANQVGKQLSITIGQSRGLSRSVPSIQQLQIRYEVVRVQQLGLRR
ncbi:MAG: DUF3363 domain-containing protein [Sulfuriferula sp.]